MLFFIIGEEETALGRRQVRVSLKSSGRSTLSNSARKAFSFLQHYGNDDSIPEVKVRNWLLDALLDTCAVAGIIPDPGRLRAWLTEANADGRP